MHDTEQYCPSCTAVVAFEQPPCPDGHEDCPELACTLCGTAVLADAALRPVEPERPVSAHHAA